MTAADKSISRAGQRLSLSIVMNDTAGTTRVGSSRAMGVA